jgi:serine/threonine protein kinase
MALTPGSRIGAYEVTTQLGEGGMGVVFRARDTKLLRDVALKMLPDHFADDPDRLSRFQREAQLLASLNHPNIAHIYGLEQAGTTGCIVMELVEGETLDEKLKNGPLKLDEALEIAKQIADALAAAHDRGIVHRDLKPANIKLTPNGTVKVLDFGLAKALSDRAQGTEVSMMPTKVSGSMAGMVVGTAGYMSPEQARGREVDARTDIWAFGCVLYEMLTARQAFGGETTTDMIAKIVTAPPDLSLLPPEIPSSVRLLLESTLNKNPQHRLQHIGDMRLFLDQKLFPATAPLATGTTAPRRSPLKALLIGSLAALIAAAVAVAVYSRLSVPPPQSELHFELSLPGIQGLVWVSPDGQHLAYVAQPGDEARAIWIRTINGDNAQRLPRTENASAVQWSPDSRYIAFLADGKLKKIDLTGGAGQVICDAANLRGFTWNRDGVILLSKDNIIARVSDRGGDVQPITTIDTAHKEQAHVGPVFLPDGKHFIYLIIGLVPENAGFFVGSLDGGMPKRVLPLPNQINGLAYVNGYLLLVGGRLTAQRFNESTLAVEGDPILLADGVEGAFSVSDNGLLFYRKGSGAPPTKQLIWFDGSGKQVGEVGAAAANYGNVELSPKGDRVAVDINTNGNRDIWVIDIARSVPSRITFENSPEWSPSWSSDESRLIFASTRDGGTGVYSKSSSGVGSTELVFSAEKNEVPVSWSRDGRYAVFSRQHANAGAAYDTWLLDMSGEKKATPLVESPFDKVTARISPDGRWIAYATNDTGMYQIVVQSFPDPNGGRWQITAQGGFEPKWRHDGRELYYLAFDGKLMAVPIKTDKTFEAGTAAPLFETPLQVGRSLSSRDRRYDVSSDGRFLIVTPMNTAGPQPIVAVVNWMAGLAKK